MAIVTEIALKALNTVALTALDILTSIPWGGGW